MKLRVGYLISGIATGFVLLFGFLTSLPDGMLHITFCDVGQGDAAYIRFADGRDMLIDGGPNNKVLECLRRAMPFWDRSLDMVVLTHPQKDHLQGLIEVVRRYRVGHFVKSDSANTSEGYQVLMRELAAKHVPIRHVVQAEGVKAGNAAIRFLWPSGAQIAKGAAVDVLGASTMGDLNDYSIVFHLRYGNFDALFTGDADTRVETGYLGMPLSADGIEVLKVPHHGSKTGMSEEYLDWLQPSLAVISVGKNTYGHPAANILTMLEERGIKTFRTDEHGDIRLVTDGVGWKIMPQM